MQDIYQVRKAIVKDASAIAGIVNYQAQKGTMLQRPISKIYDNLRDYYVVEHNGEIIGCGALHVTWSDLAEVRAVAMKDGFNGKGYGSKLVEKLIEEAKSLEIEKVFVLTYQDKFFERMGFKEIDKSDLPQKIWSECVNCVYFPDCDEIAMIKFLKH